MYLVRSINPATSKLSKTFDTISNLELAKKVESSYNCFMYHQGVGTSFLGKSCKKMSSLASLLYSHKEEFSNLITSETGKLPIQANNEIDNCIMHLNFMIDNAPRYLKDERPGYLTNYRS